MNPITTRASRLTAQQRRKGSLIALAGLALLYGVLSGIRWPGLWPLTFLLFDYSDGFIKRGLVGELLSFLLGERIGYATLATVSFAIFALWLTLLIRRLTLLGARDTWHWVVAAAFFAAPGSVYLVNTIGYLDHFGLLSTLVCLLLPASTMGTVLRCVLCLAMVFAHEAFFLMFFPVVALDAWLQARTAGRSEALASTLVLALVTAIATFVAGHSLLPPAQLEAFSGHVAARAIDFSVRPEALAVVSTDASTNIELAARHWQRYNLGEIAIVASVELFPLPVVLALLALSMTSRSSLSRCSRWLAGLGICVTIGSPLLLKLFAGDLWRFWSLTQMTALLVLLVVSTHLRVALMPPGRTKLVGTGLVVLGLAGAITSIPLFNGYPRAKPPFHEHFDRLIQVLQGTTPWLQIPPPGV